MTHASVKGTPLAVPENVVRLSVGIESVDDLIADLDAALAKRRRHAPPPPAAARRRPRPAIAPVMRNSSSNVAPVRAQ
jgi:hypothetical protein